MPIARHCTHVCRDTSLLLGHVYVGFDFCWFAFLGQESCVQSICVFLYDLPIHITVRASLAWAGAKACCLLPWFKSLFPTPTAYREDTSASITNGEAPIFHIFIMVLTHVQVQQMVNDGMMAGAMQGAQAAFGNAGLRNALFSVFGGDQAQQGGGGGRAPSSANNV